MAAVAAGAAARTRLGAAQPSAADSTVMAARAPMAPRNTCGGQQRSSRAGAGRIEGQGCPTGGPPPGVAAAATLSPPAAAPAARAHRLPRVPHRQDGRYEEGLVANLAGQDDAPGLEEALDKAMAQCHPARAGEQRPRQGVKWPHKQGEGSLAPLISGGGCTTGEWMGGLCSRLRQLWSTGWPPAASQLDDVGLPPPSKRSMGSTAPKNSL